LLQDAHAVIHLAAITDAAGSFDKAAQVEANNYQATKKVAEACLEAGVRLIALSSTSVYGTQNEVVAEDCSPEELKPQSPYALTKLKEEELIAQLCAQRGLKAISCRFGTIFGASPGMRFHTAVNKFCWQAVMGSRLRSGVPLMTKSAHISICSMPRGLSRLLSAKTSSMAGFIMC